MADVLPEGFEPDPEGFEPDEVPADFEADPEGFEPDAPVDQPDPSDERLKLAHRLSTQQKPEAAMQNWATANHLGVPLRLVESDPQGWAKTAMQAAFEPKVWRQENPELAKVALQNPALAPTIISNKELGFLVQGLNKAKDLRDWLMPAISWKTEMMVSNPKTLYPIVSVLGGLNDDEQADVAKMNELIATGLTAEQAKAEMLPAIEARQAAAKAEREKPRRVEEIDDERARVFREWDGPATAAFITYKRIEEAQLGLEASKLTFELMNARDRGDADTNELEQRVRDAKMAAKPRAFGEGPFMQSVNTSAAAGVSTIEMLKSAASFGGAGALAGAAVGGAAGAIEGRSANAAAAGARAGAKLVGRKGAEFGAFYGSYVLESASTYDELENVKTDDGNALSEPARRGAAKIAGFFKAGLEVLELNQMASNFGPLRTLLQGKPAEIIKRASLSDPAFRNLLMRYAKTTMAEMAEEGGQQLIDDLTRYLTASGADRKAQKLSPYIARAETGVLEAMSAAGPFAAFSGGLGVMSTVAPMYFNVGQSQAAEKQPAAILAMAADPTSQAAPELMAQLVSDSTAKTGEEVKALHVKGEALERYFQKHKPEDAQAEMVAALGPEGPAKVAEAIATGSSLEVPLATAMSTYGQSPMAKALEADTATQPGHLTPRELAEGGAEKVQAQAEALATAEIEKTRKDEELKAESDTLREQLLARGFKKNQANALVAAKMNEYRVLADRQGVSAKEMFDKYRTEFGIGDEAQAVSGNLRLNQPNSDDPHPASRELAAVFHKIKQEKRPINFYIDKTTGLLNDRAFKRIDPAGRVGALISVEGLGYINNNLGHEAGDSVYRAAAQALRPKASEVAKVGGDFRVYVKDQAALDTLLAEANKNPALRGHQLEGILHEGDDWVETGKRLGAEKRKAEDAGKRAEKSARPLNATYETPTHFDAKLFEDTQISDDLLAKYAEIAKAPEKEFNEIYIEESTGLLTYDGFLARTRKKYLLSIDMNGLKEMSDKISYAFGDLALVVFGNTMRDLGMTDLNGTHKSGDEYLAESDDEEELKRWAANAFEALMKAEVGFKVKDVELQKALKLQGTEAVLEGLPFGYGIGENVDDADAQLNEHKERLKQQGLRGDGAVFRRIKERGESRPVARGAPQTPGSEDRADVIRRERQRLSSRRHRFVAKEDLEKTRLNQEHRSDETTASEAGFHSPNAFGTPGTPEHAIANDMLEELAALPVEHLSSAVIHSAWEKAFPRGEELARYNRANTAETENLHKNYERIEAAARNEAQVLPAGVPIEQLEIATVDDLVRATEEPAGDQPFREESRQRRSENYWRDIEKAVRLAVEKGDRTLLYALDPENPAPRGYFEKPGPLERIYRAFFNKKATVSTVLHEGAHAYLEIVADIAESPDATEASKQYFADVLKALGVEKRSDITRDQHETWAKAYEAFAFEGKGPTPALEKLFHKFSLWLKSIYRTIRSIDVELTPELRDVFERMHATDEEIQQAKARHGPPMFDSAEAAGVSPEQWLAQKQNDDEIADAGTQRAQRRVLKDRLRETEKWWKDERAKYAAEFELAYEELPARKAQKILSGEAVDGVKVGPFVLLRSRVQSVIGNLKVPGLKTSTDESEVTGADDVAAMAGFPTGDVMLAALAGLKPADAWVNEQADAKMALLHPDVLEDRTELRKLIEDGLERYTSQRILRELAELGRRSGANVSGFLEAAKAAASRIVEARRFGDIAPGRALAGERASANTKAKAAAKGDWVAALEAGKQQILNAAVHRELLQAVEERDALVGLARELASTKSQQRLGKASPIYRDAVDFILEAFEFKDVNEGRETQLDAGVIDQAVATLESDAMTIGEWRDNIKPLLPKPSADMTVADMRVISDALKNIRAAARQRNTVIVEGRRAEKTEVIEQLLREFESTLPKQAAPGTKESTPFLERIGRWLKWGVGFQLTIPRMAAHLTGNDLSSMTYRALIEPMRKANALEADLYTSAIKPIIEAFEEIPKGIRARAAEKVDGEKLFPNHTTVFAAPRERFELLMMALNAGNAGNLQRLLDGRNISEAQLQAALDLLTKEELGWVQSVFDASEKLRPLAFDLEERDSGIRPQAVVATPRAFKNGTLQGGYFPAIYERSASQIGERQAAQQLDQLFDQSYTRGSTPHGHLKKRADKVVAVISLSPGRIASSIAQVAHDIAFREAVKSVGGLILSPEIDTALKERLGPEKAQFFLRWVKDIGTMNGANNPAANAFLQLMQFVKSNLAPAVLGFNKAVALGDYANLGAAITSTGLKAKHLSAAMREFGAAPFQTRAMALEKSGQLRALQDDFKRTFATQLKSLTLTGGRAGRAFQTLKDHSFVLQEAVAYQVNTAVWVGAYRQALSEEKSEADAIRFADDVLLRTTPSHSPVEMSSLLRDKGPASAAIALFGYMNLVFNDFVDLAQPLVQTKFQEAGIGRKASTLGKVAVSTLAFILTYEILGAVLMGRGPNEDDDDEDDPGNQAKRYRNWALRKVVLAPLHSVPLPFGAIGESLWTKKKLNARSSPLLSLAEDLGRTLAKVRRDDVDEFDKALAVLKSMALLLGAPINPVTTTGKYLYEVSAGDRKVPSAGRAIGGVIYGERDKQGDNVPQVIGDVMSGDR